MLVHSGQKPFRCKECRFSCSQAENLKRHMLVHSGKKPHSCEQCKYSCTRGESLKRHMLVHSGERPFSCKQCNYSCTRAGTLKKHMHMHRISCCSKLANIWAELDVQWPKYVGIWCLNVYINLFIWNFKHLKGRFSAVSPLVYLSHLLNL